MTAALRRGRVGEGATRSMCSLQRGEPVGGDPLGEQAPGNRRPGRRRSARPEIVPRVVSIAGGSTAWTSVWRRNVDAVRLGQPAGQRGDRPCAISTRSSCGLHSAAAQSRSPPASGSGARPRRRQAARSPRPSRSRGRPRARPRASGRRAATARPRCSIRMPAAGATSAQTSRERMARRQHSPCLLAGDGDEAEIADRGAVGLRVAVDHRDLEPAPRRRQRVGKPADAGADDGEIEAARALAVTACARPASGRGSPA